ncbi:MAG: LysR family transcriptional regulator [Polaromonas sp.]|nr:LysR family transcriptional regulator [Polaromonas sp.]
MDSRQLRYFAAVAQLGSFSAAARQLHIAQPALSRHVKALEDALGVKLLMRSVSGVSTTQEGAELLAKATQVLEQLDSLSRSIGPRSQDVSGRVVLGLPHSTAAVLATPLLRAAIDQYPHVRLHVIDSLSGYLREWIESGRLDLAVLFDPLPTAGIRLDPIMVEDFCLVGQPGSWPQEQQDIALREIANRPLIIPSAAHSNRRLLESAVLSHGVRLNIVAEVDSLAIQKLMVLDGQVFSILTHGSIYNELAAGTLQAVRIVEPTISRSVMLASAMSRSANHACNAIHRLTLETALGLLRAQVWRGHSLSG